MNETNIPSSDSYGRMSCISCAFQSISEVFGRLWCWIKEGTDSTYSVAQKFFQSSIASQPLTEKEDLELLTHLESMVLAAKSAPWTSLKDLKTGIDELDSAIKLIPRTAGLTSSDKSNKTLREEIKIFSDICKNIHKRFSDTSYENLELQAKKNFEAEINELNGYTQLFSKKILSTREVSVLSSQNASTVAEQTISDVATQVHVLARNTPSSAQDSIKAKTVNRNDTVAKLDQVAQNALKAQQKYNPNTSPSEKETTEKNNLIENCKKQLKELHISDSYLSLSLLTWERLPPSRRKNALEGFKLQTANLIEIELEKEPKDSERFTILKKALDQFNKGIFTNPYSNSQENSAVLNNSQFPSLESNLLDSPGLQNTTSGGSYVDNSNYSTQPENSAKYEIQVNPKIRRIYNQMRNEKVAFGNIDKSIINEARKIGGDLNQGNTSPTNSKRTRMVTMVLPQNEITHRSYNSYKVKSRVSTQKTFPNTIYPE